MASFAWRIRGIEPASDARWQSAGEDVHRAFWREVVALALEVKDRELAAGLDRNGIPMTRIAESTRRHRRSAMGPADPDAPPLQPAHALSRTRSLLAGRAMADHAEFFWRYDEHTEGSWGKILDYHRRGLGSSGRHIPQRDVFGLSSNGIQEVQRRSRIWWANYRAGRIPLSSAGKRLVKNEMPKPKKPGEKTEPKEPKRPPHPQSEKGRKARGQWTYREINPVHVEYHTKEAKPGEELGAFRIWEFKGGDWMGRGPRQRPAPASPKPASPSPAPTMNPTVFKPPAPKAAAVKPKAAQATTKPKPAEADRPIPMKGPEKITPVSGTPAKVATSARKGEKAPPNPFSPHRPETENDRRFRAFDDEDVMQAWTEEHFGRWRQSLSDRERRTLEEYQGSDYQVINGRLRALARGERYPEDIRTFSDVPIAEATDAMKRIVSHPLPEDVTLWRGASPQAFGVANRESLAALKGTVVEDAAFVSTSLEQGIAESSDFMKGVVIQIRAPKGTLSAPVRYAIGGELGGEREILLQAGTRFRVLNVETLWSKATLVEVEVVR